MNFTLFGYPKSGKTTLFNLLTGAKIDTSAFDSRKKEPNLRTCSVPDSRLDKIHAYYPDKKKIAVVIDYIDLAGISYGDVKNDAYLSYLRKADGLTQIVRGFKDDRIPSPKGKIDPREDILSMEDELILADLVSVESRIEKLEKDLKRMKNPEGEKEKDLLERIQAHLGEGKGLRELGLSEKEDKLIRSFAFLSQKPLLHMINLDEKDIPAVETPEKFFPTSNKGTSVLAFCDLLDVITFFTIGKQEVKAWTIKNNSTASTAAGTIHTDIEKGFIRAEVISCSQLLEFASLQEAKENGAVRLEGKGYIVQDGDVIYFRFSA